MIDGTVRIAPNGRSLPGNGSKVEAPTKRALSGAKPGRTVDTRLSKLGVGWDSYLKPKANIGREKGTIDVIRAIRDLDPVVSQATWNYLRLLNPGHDLKAYNDAGEELAEDSPQQQFLNDLAARVGHEYGGGLDQLHNVMAITLLTTGAIAAEVEPNGSLNDVVDWHVVDPLLLTFKRDPETKALLLGQQKSDGTFEELPEAQVFYQPLDPDEGDPYGRPPLLSAIQSVMSKAMMLNDVRAVAHQTGFPRIEVEIVWEAVQNAAPPQLKEPGREQDYAEWAEKQLGKIVSDYGALQVDDVIVHYDWAKPKLMAASGLSFDFAALDGVLQRQLNSAIKMLPVLLGINESTSETHGSVQWQIQVAGIEALQRVIKRLVERMAKASAELAGLVMTPKMQYDTTRTVDRLYEAQAELFEAQNLKTDVEMGWRDNDEAAEMRTGHAATADPGEQIPAPAPAMPQTVGDQGGQNPDAKEKQQTTAKNAAWQLLLSKLLSAANAPAPHRGTTLDGERLDELANAYAEEGETLFLQELEKLVLALSGEGLQFASPLAGITRWGSKLLGRMSAKEMVEEAFGLGFRREMKGLLRTSIEQGLREAGVYDETVGVPRKLVREIWRTNEPFIRRMRDDLADQVRSWQSAAKAGKPATLADVRDWFAANSYREAMMGRFLAKQGIASGWAYGMTAGNPLTVFEWTLGPVKTEHCTSCSERSGKRFTAAQLRIVGMPGSTALQCMSNCKCTLVAQECGVSDARRSPLPAIRSAELTEEELAALPEDELRRLLKEEGYSPEEIDAGVKSYRNMGGSKAEACSIAKTTAPAARATDPKSARRMEDGMEQVAELQPDDAKALYEYTYNSNSVAYSLRHGDGTHQWAPGLDRIAESYRVDQPTTLFRQTQKITVDEEFDDALQDYRTTKFVMGKGKEESAEISAGQTFADRSYLSTSRLESKAEEFGISYQESSIGDRAMWEITVPKGANAIPANRASAQLNLSQFEDFEGGRDDPWFEVILPRNSTLRIDAIEPWGTGGNIRVKATVVP